MYTVMSDPVPLISDPRFESDRRSQYPRQTGEPYDILGQMYEKVV